jgi:hypothetical protein
MFVAECPEVGTVSQGATIEDAVVNPQRGYKALSRRVPHPLLYFSRFNTV